MVVICCQKGRVFPGENCLKNEEVRDVRFTVCAAELKQILLGTNLWEDEYASNQSRVEIAAACFFLFVCFFSPFLFPSAVLHEQNSLGILCKY